MCMFIGVATLQTFEAMNVSAIYYDVFILIMFKFFMFTIFHALPFYHFFPLKSVS